MSGDLSDDRSDESYSRLKALTEPLGLPLDIIPGNHDTRESMRSAFPDRLPLAGPLNWQRQIGEVHMIGLDTLVEGKGSGELSDSSLGFLKDALTTAGNLPVLLALHHPPFQCGIGFMDDIGLANRKDFCEVVASFQGELRIVCGHIHSMMVTAIAGHVTTSAPAPSSTFSFDRRANAPIGFMELGDGCLLHRWDNGFQTVRIGPIAGHGPFPF